MRSLSRHYWDNKLLPTQVMPEEARAEKKWFVFSLFDAHLHTDFVDGSLDTGGMTPSISSTT